MAQPHEESFLFHFELRMSSVSSLHLEAGQFCCLYTRASHEVDIGPIACS